MGKQEKKKIVIVSRVIIGKGGCREVEAVGGLLFVENDPPGTAQGKQIRVPLTWAEDRQ